MKSLLQYDFQPQNVLNKLRSLVLLGAFLLIISSKRTTSHFLVKTLPGFQGDLPFKLETGYIGVGESDDVQLFYYFIESEGNPKNDPLLLWLTGGPGCSSLYGLLYEIGPFTINPRISTMEKQIVEINPHSWTKAASIIFIDQPAGSGFSYAKTPEAYITNVTLSSILAYQFIKKWLLDHPEFLNNSFYVGASSYAGVYVPIIVDEIYNGNEAGEVPNINIKGYTLGNAGTDLREECNSRIRFAHHTALLSDAIYELTKENCRGEYVNVDPTNSRCMIDLHVVHKCLDKVFNENILEPYCKEPNITDDLLRRGLRSLDNNSMHTWSLPQVRKLGCRLDNYQYSEPWANSREVRVALHIREEFNEIKWVFCNDSLRFYIDKEPISNTHNVWNVVPYHRQLTRRKCRALVYSGDLDMVVPHIATLNWVESLNLKVVDDWRPWYVEEQVAGYTVKYSNHNYNLTFATVKGAGHTAPEYKPKECSSMFVRWLANDDV